MASKKESFVDDTQAKQITGTIFIVIGCMALAATVSFLLYWSYTQDKRLFSAILWTFIFVYSVINVTFAAISKNRLKPMVFRFFIALHSSIGIMSMVLLIFYYVRASKGMVASDSGQMYNNFSPQQQPM
jgi:hypothetical protein